MLSQGFLSLAFEAGVTNCTAIHNLHAWGFIEVEWLMPFILTRVFRALAPRVDLPWWREGCKENIFQMTNKTHSP